MRWLTFLTASNRNAVDFGIVLINNGPLADLWVSALGKKMFAGELNGYREGNVPKSVKPWSQWIGSHN